MEDAASFTVEFIYGGIVDPPCTGKRGICQAAFYRKLAGINFLEEDAPDATTLPRFRRLLERHGPNRLFFAAINRVMVQTGHMLKGGEEIASDEHLATIDYRICRRLSSLQKVSDNSADRVRIIEHAKFSVRCKAEPVPTYKKMHFTSCKARRYLL